MVAGWIKKTKTTLAIWYLQDTNFRSKDIHSLKLRRWKKIFHGNGNDKKLSSSNSKEKREDPMNKVRNERGDLTINIRKIKKS